MSDPNEITALRVKALRYWAKLYVEYRKGTLAESELYEWQKILEKKPEIQTWIAQFEIESFENESLGVYGRFEKGIDKAIIKFHIDAEREAQRTHFLKTAWFRYAAAIIVMFGIAAYLWNMNKSEPQKDIATIEPSSIDIQPGGQHATLTLADGRQIILDSATNGQLAVESGSEIIKRDGRIIYGSPPIPSGGGVDPTAGNSNINNSSVGAGVGYNIMSTPKGGQYQLTLVDGTKVWLNAASSITFPTRFQGDTREVQVEGEVYFEVAKNKLKPFIVNSRNDKVMVLGTAFNINNYPDEPESKISLVDGSVKVNEKLLRPGQAYVGGKISTTNIEQDIAWVSGLFNFQDVDVKEAMRQLARWYDLEIEFRGEMRLVEFNGKISRSLTLQQVIGGLEGMGNMHFSLIGRKLIVTL